MLIHLSEVLTHEGREKTWDIPFEKPVFDGAEGSYPVVSSEPVHIVLLAAASGDVGIGLLRGWAEIDLRHNDASLSLHFMRRRAVSCADFLTLRGDRAKIKRRRSVSLFSRVFGRSDRSLLLLLVLSPLDEQDNDQNGEAGKVGDRTGDDHQQTAGD